MADRVCGERKAQRHPILRIAVNPVSANLLHQRRQRLWPRLIGLVRPFVPHHHGEQDAHAAAMEVGNHLAHTINAAGHGLNHLKLVAVVDPHVWIGSPDEHRINAAVALFYIVEVAIDSVTASQLIVEIAIVNHHLRLHKARLGPAECRHLVARRIESGADAALGAPVFNVAQPALVCIGRAPRLHGTLDGMEKQIAGGSGNLLVHGRELRILGCRTESDCCC